MVMMILLNTRSWTKAVGLLFDIGEHHPIRNVSKKDAIYISIRIYLFSVFDKAIMPNDCVKSPDTFHGRN